ncbi:MAG: class I tRNA ligase family protein [Pseudomonadota bacterium]
MRLIGLTDYDTEFYGVNCQRAMLPNPPGSLLGCMVPPGAESATHNHFENELFYFTSGEGEVTNGEETIRVGPGKAVLFEGFEPHTIRNLDPDAPLAFLSLYWPASVEASTDNDIEAPAPLLVFSTPPTPNGDLHLGHLSGPYLAGDMLRRATPGVSYHVTGRDDHQSYVALKAEQAGVAPDALAEENAEAILSTLEAAQIPLAHFISPDQKGPYASFIREGVRRLAEAGVIVARAEEAAFDPTGRYLHEAFISGACPHCGEGSDGNACEACGRPNACVDLRDARGTLTGARPKSVVVERLYFRLSAYERELKAYVATADLPAHVCSLCLAMIEDGLPDICISHPGEWGVACPIDGLCDQRVYVWFEMAFGYLWAASAVSGETDPARAFEAAARVYNGDMRIAHCYGFDNAWYHALFFPAIYIALGVAPPRHHIVNEFLDLEGLKFSTSRNHLIWGRDLLEAWPADYVRFALAAYRPEGARADFSRRAAAALVREIFCETLQGWLEDIETRAGSFDWIAPESGAWSADQAAYYRDLVARSERVQHATRLRSFSPRKIAEEFAGLVRSAALFARSQRAYFEDGSISAGNYRRTALSLDLVGLSLLRDIARILTPELGGALGDYLRGATSVDRTFGSADFLAAGGRLPSGRVAELAAFSE